MLSLIKSVTNHERETDIQCCLLIYKMLTRSRLDYGAIIYNSTNQTTLRKLNPIHSEALMIAMGAFKFSPTDSLSVLTNEMPLSL